MFGNDHTHRATNRTWIIDTRSWQWVTSVSRVDPAQSIKIVVRYDDNGNNNDDNGLPYNKIAGSVVGGIACLVMYYYLSFSYLLIRSICFINSIQLCCINQLLAKQYIFVFVYYISKRRSFFFINIYHMNFFK